jgi:uncharacterized membrane protein
MVSVTSVDRIVGGLTIAILGIGIYSWIRATFLVQSPTGMMGMMSGTDPIWYLFGTIVTASLVVGIYLFSRERIRQEFAGQPTATEASAEDLSEDDEPAEASTPDSTSGPRQRPQLEYLPEDERRVLEPVLESPGLTQVELRGRSDFSKAKVSQTVSELEDRGLLYREKQGRTYRIYPGEPLKGNS